MARQNKKTELWSHLTSGIILRDKSGTAGSTTLGAATAVNDATLTVAAITNFAVAEPIRVGRGEDTEYMRIHGSTAPATTVITLEASTPARLVHAIGDPVVELEAVNMGALDEGGVQIEMSGSTEDINAATERLLYGMLHGHSGIKINFGLLGWSLENWALKLGMNESTRVVGSGTATAARHLNVDFTRVREQNDIALQFLGARKDGTVFKVTCMACELDPSGSVTLARGTKTVLPVSALVTGAILLENY